MNLKLYLILLVIDILIIIVNYYELNHPNPYPPEKVRRELKGGRVTLSSCKYIGLSHYILPRLVNSESDWSKGNAYWHRSFVKLGCIAIFITLIAMILTKVFPLNMGIGISMSLAPLILGMIFISYKMETLILND